MLPTIHDHFSVNATELIQAIKLDGVQNVRELVTSKLLLSKLTVSLQHHMAYTCTVCKYGTLVYKPGKDLAPLLCEALWKLRKAESQSVSTLTTDTYTPSESTGLPTIDSLNLAVLAQIRRFLAEDAKSPFEYDSINFESIIQQMDPQLWQAVCLLTRSMSERRGISKANDPSSRVYQTKRIRRIFLLCSLLFCTDDRCSMPVHTLMTDLVESQGGSALLIKIMNRLGACASADTLSRFIQYKVTSLDQRKQLKPDSFTVVSADNVDFLHSYARVFCGNQNSSWHGTTVQAAQPLPSLDEYAPPSLGLEDPSRCGTFPTSLGLENPSRRGTLPTSLGLADPSRRGTLPTSLGLEDPSRRGTLPTSLGLEDPSRRGTLPTMGPTSLGLEDPSRRGTLPTSLGLEDPSRRGTLPTSLGLEDPSRRDMSIFLIMPYMVPFTTSENDFGKMLQTSFLACSIFTHSANTYLVFSLFPQPDAKLELRL